MIPPQSLPLPPPRQSCRSATGPAGGWDPAGYGPCSAAALGLLAVALSLSGLLLVLVPQRLAQRPARQGVIVLHLDRSGGLRLWNQPLPATALMPLLQRAARTTNPPVLRLRPDREVPWRTVQVLAGELERLPLSLELQLP